MYIAERDAIFCAQVEPERKPQPLVREADGEPYQICRTHQPDGTYEYAPRLLSAARPVNIAYIKFLSLINILSKDKSGWVIKINEYDILRISLSFILP